MDLGIFAFGHAGCSIANELLRFDQKTNGNICSYVTAFDTDDRHLASHDRIESTIPFGHREFNGKGSDSDIEPVVQTAEQIRDTIIKVARQERKKDIDGFLLIGSLGGGTGGGGVAVCADVLSEKYPTLPLYGVGILPSQDEPDIMTLTASRALQSWVDKTDSVILYDNDHLGVGIPSLTNGINEDQTSHEDIFPPTNEVIARTLNLIFSADEQHEYTENEMIKQQIPTPDELIETFSAGGMSTISYASVELPKPMWPGFRGKIHEFIYSLYTSARTQNHQNDTDPPTGDNQDVITEQARQTDQNKQNKPDWPHPADLVPQLFQDSAVLCGTDPSLCQHSYTLLIGQERLFNQTDANNVRSWVEKTVESSQVKAGIYPINSRKISALQLSAGIGLQPRIDNLHTDAEMIIERILAEQQKTRGPKSQNIFQNYETTIPPAIQ